VNWQKATKENSGVIWMLRGDTGWYRASGPPRLGVGYYLLCLGVSVCVPAETVENRNAARRWKNEAAD